jgi:hypothetical protein
MVATCIGIAGTACQAVAETVRENRPVGGIDSIVVRVPGSTRVEQGARESLAIEADKDVLPKLTTEVRNGVLYIEANQSFKTRDPIRFRITVTHLSAVTSEGGGEVTLGRFELPHLDLKLSGSGTVMLDSITGKQVTAALAGSGSIVIQNGAVDSQLVSIAGAGAYSAPGLVSRDASVDISGSGTVLVNARETLSAGIGGSGMIRYRGSPVVTPRISGAGFIMRDFGGMLGAQ